MSNKLNFSSLNDAWGIPEPEPETKKFNYQKPKENIMSIDSNEIKKPMRQEFKPVQETYSDYIKPCTLVDEHIKNCEICKSKLTMQKTPQIEHMSNISNISNQITETYNSFDLNESFENISPSQKNLLIVVLYGLLIILISDLIIKEKNE
jgi:hypothetical protein